MVFNYPHYATVFNKYIYLRCDYTFALDSYTAWSPNNFTIHVLIVHLRSINQTSLLLTNLKIR